MKCYSNCLLWAVPVNWASRASSLTHKHAHMTAPKDLECASGMNISRHWSRHAFRDIPKAQYTFKSLLVHGILQFTMLITLRCALHRCSSRDIRRWKLCLMQWGGQPPRAIHRHMCISTNNGSFTAKEDGPMLIHYPRTSARGSRCDPQPRTEAHKWEFTVKWLDTCEWSFRRFTYGNLVTTSPSSKW